MRGLARHWYLGTVLLLGPAACYDKLAAVGPGVKLTASPQGIDVRPGGRATVFVQVLDVNGAGVDGARVTFTLSDPGRVTWLDAPLGSDAVTATTSMDAPSGVSATGVARALIGVPEAASPGDAAIVAVLKSPADPASAITARITVRVTPGDAGTMSDGGHGAGGAGSSGASGDGALQDSRGEAAADVDSAVGRRGHQ